MAMSGRTVKVLLISFVLVPIIILCLSVYVMEAHPVSESKAASIVAGMSGQDVESVLGIPSDIYGDNGRKQWIYSKPMLWNFFVVELSGSGNVIEAYWDD